MSDEQKVNVQAVFDKVIEAKVYPSHSLMCTALGVARLQGHISEREQLAAKTEIEGYLYALGSRGEGVQFLVRSLRENKMDHSVEARVKIYKDWANRPFPGGEI